MLPYITRKFVFRRTEEMMKKIFFVLCCTLLLGVSIGEIEVKSGSNAKYTYDNLNRVVRIDYNDGSYTTYMYDKAGNITSVKTVKAEKKPVESPNSSSKPEQPTNPQTPDQDIRSANGSRYRSSNPT